MKEKQEGPCSDELIVLYPDCMHVNILGVPCAAVLQGITTRASQVAQMVKNLPAMWETWVQSLSWEYPLEEEMATHSSSFAWRIPWTQEAGRLQSTRLQRVGHD